MFGFTLISNSIYKEASYFSYAQTIVKPDFPFFSSKRGPALTIKNFQEIPNRFNFLTLLPFQLSPSLLLFPPASLPLEEERACAGIQYPLSMLALRSPEILSFEAHSRLEEHIRVLRYLA